MTLNFAPCNMRGCGPSADQLGEMLHSIDIYAGCSGQIVPEGSCSIVPKNKKLQNKTLLCADKKLGIPGVFLSLELVCGTDCLQTYTQFSAFKRQPITLLFSWQRQRIVTFC